ncbi:hypothetical protein C6P40_001599 [Pichia californica]|uniref:E3 ubiquitin-protein ligase n=1 Tax=Pichia californica TaxID=460514 RepID=A0A9P6WJ76_9ASCO|nr:hypothetical protein C6P40_001599 [[Candida] californica]
MDLDGEHDLFTHLRLFLLTLASQNEYKYTKNVRSALKNELSRLCGIDSRDLIIDETNHTHYGRTCGHRFLRGETCWRCLTCGYDETCALCWFCFNEEEHAGHEIHKSIIQRDFAGCCDCGDLEAYSNCQCELYKTPSNNKIYTNINNEFINKLTDFLGVLLDFIIDITNHSVSCLSPPQRADQIRLSHQTGVLNAKVYHGNDYDSHKYALILYSDQVHQFKDAVQRIRFTTGKVLEYAEMIATRCNEHGRAVVMVSDNLQFLLRKQDILTSTGLTACITNVREVFREEMCDDIISWIYELSQSNISKSNWPVRCTISVSFLRPYNKGCMNQWLDVYHEKVLLNPLKLRTNITTTGDNDANKSLANKWELSDDLKNDCQYYDTIKESDSYNGSRLQFLLLFDVRFCKKTRINLHNIYIPPIAKNTVYGKMLVAQFIDVYDTILTLFLLVDREPELSVMPLLSTQLFSSPSNDSLILKHGDMSKMIKTIYSYVTTGQTTNIAQSSENTILSNKSGVVFSTLKNRKWAHVLIDLSYVVTRNPDIENIFTVYLSFPEYVHFLAVFQSKPVFHREAEKHVEYESQDYTVFFNAVSVISHFSENLGKILSRVSKDRLLSQGNSMDCWYHSYSNSMKKPFTETLYVIIIRKIIELTFGEKKEGASLERFYHKIIDDKEDAIELQPCQDYPGLSEIKFDVMKGKISFLHPLHNMFSWLVEMDQSMDSEKSLLNLMDIIQGEYEFYLNEKIGSTKIISDFESSKYEGVMGFFDIPLRKLVLVSQIKVGLWVRNGASIKSQMNLYRYGGSREFGYMRDLFLCQIYVGYFRYAQLVMYTIFDRWKLLSWVYGDMETLPYSAHHMHAILEEFILFMIYLVSEDLHLHKRNAVEVTDLLIQKEIVHSLCFDSKSHEEIISCIPDHICSLKRFPVIFQKCVVPIKNYSEISQERIYKLKPEYLDTIDPYYVHFNSNRRDNCIFKMKEHIAKIKHMEPVDVIIEPKNIEWNNGPFERVVDVLLDEKLLAFLHTTLLHCKMQIQSDSSEKKSPIKENTESLLNLTLHLTHIAMKHKNIKEVKDIELFNIFVELHNIFELNLLVELHPKIKCIMQIIYKILESMQFNFHINLPTFDSKIFNNDFVRSVSDTKSLTDISYDKKKKLAKKKRNKLLAKLRKQQQKFAENFKINDISECSAQESGNEMTKSIEFIQDFKLSSGDENNINSNYVGDTVDSDSDNDDSDCPAWKFPEHTCLLCHKPPADENEVFGIFSYITESNEFRYVPTHDDYWFYKGFGGNSNLDEQKTEGEKLRKYIDPIEFDSVIGPGFPSSGESEDVDYGFNDNMAVITSCSHGMHDHCFKQYYESSMDKQLSQITRTTPENIQRFEFICPLCKCVNNVFIPVCYFKNNKKFHEKFEKKIEMKDILSPKLDSKILKDVNLLSNIRDELLGNVKSSVKSKDWFIGSETTFGNIKSYTFNPKSKIPNALKDCMIAVQSVSPPFESFGLVIGKTIESIEILLRGEGFSDKNNNKLVAFQLNNRSLTTIRVWLQISEILKSTLGIQDSRSKSDESQLLYAQSLIGSYSNLLEDNQLMLNGQDYFTGLIHCEELRCIGYTFQRLAGIFFIKHINQSIMKVLVVLAKRKDNINIELLKTNEFNGDRSKLKTVICCFLKITDCSEDLIDIVYSMVIKLVTPFLRKVLILAYAKYARFDETKINMPENVLECDKICEVMKLVKLDEVLKELNICLYSGITDMEKELLFKTRVPYPGVIRLIHLPIELNDLYISYYNRITEDKRIEEPGICLTCGEMVEVQKNRYGDDYGSCTMHLSWECINGGRGMFFLPRNNCLLLLDNGKGCFVDSPYRDEHGETDKDCKKGNNLQLSVCKYIDIEKKVWLMHNIQNVIAQKLENLTDIGGWSTL